MTTPGTASSSEEDRESDTRIVLGAMFGWTDQMTNGQKAMSVLRALRERGRLMFVDPGHDPAADRLATDLVNEARRNRTQTPIDGGTITAEDYWRERERAEAAETKIAGAFDLQNRRVQMAKDHYRQERDAAIAERNRLQSVATQKINNLERGMRTLEMERDALRAERDLLAKFNHEARERLQITELDRERVREMLARALHRVEAAEKVLGIGGYTRVVGCDGPTWSPLVNEVARANWRKLLDTEARLAAAEKDKEEQCAMREMALDHQAERLAAAEGRAAGMREALREIANTPDTHATGGESMVDAHNDGIERMRIIARAAIADRAPSGSGEARP